MFAQIQPVRTRILTWIHPQDSVNEAEVHKGLQMLLYDGICFQIMSVLTSGAFLVAFALLLNASHLVIGIIAAVGPLTWYFPYIVFHKIQYEPKIFCF